MHTVLFFDDCSLQRRVNMERHVGRAALVQQGAFVDPHADTAWGYPTVLSPGADRERWLCYYQGRVQGAGTLQLLAASDDGIEWEPVDLSGKVALQERAVPHQLVEPSGEWCCVFEDERASAHERYKALRSRSRLALSADGIHWVYRESAPWSPLNADPGFFAYWNPYRGRYVISLRPRWADRRVAVIETADWQTFTDAEWCLQPDALDTPCARIYGMPVWPYEGMFVGLIWLFRTDPVVDISDKYLGGIIDVDTLHDEEHARMLGKIDAQLVYSPNGWHFQRTLRTSPLPEAAPGEHGSGCVYPTSMVVNDGRIHIYSSASQGEHAQILERQDSAILVHTLRLDGFVYLEPAGGTGEVITQIVLWKGGELRVNVMAPHGQALMQITDQDGEPLAGYRYQDCVPFTGDTTAWIPRWRDERTMATLDKRTVRIGLRLINGRLFALRGEFELKTAPEARRFMKTGESDSPLPGF